MDRAPDPKVTNKPVYALKLQVLHRAAEINYLAVQYGNGQRDFLPVRQFFADGSSSQWIDLNGAYRCVEKIIVVADTQAAIPAGPKALIKVFGLR